LTLTCLAQQSYIEAAERTPEQQLLLISFFDFAGAHYGELGSDFGAKYKPAKFEQGETHGYLYYLMEGEYTSHFKIMYEQKTKRIESVWVTRRAVIALKQASVPQIISDFGVFV